MCRKPQYRYHFGESCLQVESAFGFHSLDNPEALSNAAKIVSSLPANGGKITTYVGCFLQVLVVLTRLLALGFQELEAFPVDKLISAI